MRFLFAPLLALLASTAFATPVPSYDDPSTTLYITEPSCGYYKCHVKWRHGQKVSVNWLNAPKGNVKVLLLPNGNGPSYTIAKSVAGTMSRSKCDGGNGVGKKGRPCGRYTFKVPSSYKKGTYSVAVQSTSHSNLIGYTDLVDIN